MNLMALLAAPANLKVTECGGVEIICQRCIQPSDRRGAWVEAALSGLWRSWGRNEPFIEPYARAAHDLKNVMLAVDNHVTNAYENPGHRFQFLAAAEQSLQRARASSRMLLMLLRQMPQAEYARFSLGPMLKSFAADIHRQVPEGVNLQVTQDSATAEVLGDEYLLHSALENLCKNAIEALDAHGSLRIEWLYDTSAKVVLIEVSDNGPGIPKNTLDAVVEGRPVASNKLNGAGLGLLSVSHVVKLHGGEFSVRSGEYGTVCTISIPILEQQVTSKSTPHSETQVVRRNVA